MFSPSLVRAAIGSRLAALLCVPILIVPQLLSAQLGAPGESPVQASLVSAADEVPAGSEVRMALQLDLAETWHTYWINPGLVGFPPKIEWTLPAGVTVGGLEFPTPIRFEGGGAAGYGYEDQVLHPFTVQLADDLETGDTIELKGVASWLACDPTSCLPPSDFEVTATIRVGAADSKPQPSAKAGELERADGRLPVSLPDAEVTAEVIGEEVEFTIDFGQEPPAELQLEGAFLFVETTELVDAAAVADFEQVEPTVIAARMPVYGTFSGEVPEDVAVVIAMTDGKTPAAAGQSWRVGPEVSAGTAPAGQSTTVSGGSAAAPPVNLWQALLGAFLGGLILNLMPCVFPVISLKIMGFVNQAGGSRRHVLYHGLIFAAGILLSFAVLAGILLAIRAAGSGAGWGFQLQNPLIIMALSVLMFVLALSLFGLFEIGTSATGVGAELVNRGGLAGSFWSGVLATVLASPCTAPFMGPALAFAMLQPPSVGMSVFLMIGVGMATPYVLLSAFPGLIRKLPRPGPWMETFKQVMGFLMLSVVVWLIWVLAQQVDADGLLFHLITLLLLGVGAWLIGRFGLPHLSARSRWTARTAALLLAAVAVYFSVEADGQRRVDDTDIYEVVEDHRQRGQHVFLDFTASWCLTCQANKPALYDEGVQERLRENNVAFVVADWSAENESIERMLAEYNRASIPFYIFLRAEGDGEPVILPQLLTPGIIHDHLDRFLGEEAG